MQPHTFRDSLALQYRVIGALMRREFITLSGRNGFGFLMIILEPTVFMLAMCVIFALRRNLDNAQFSLVSFALSGYGIMWACRFQFIKSMGVISSNLPLFYHRNVRVLDVLISRATIQMTCTTLSFMLLFFIPLFFKLFPTPDEPILIVYSWILVQWYGVNMCLFSGAMQGLVGFGDKIIQIINALHIFITGALFMVDWIPEQYRWIFLLFPMVHATEMMRDGFFNEFMITHYDVGYILITNLFMSYFSLCLVHRYSTSEAAYGRS